MSNTTAKLELGTAVVIKDAGLVYPFCVPAAEKFGLTNFKAGGGLAVQDNTQAVVSSLPEYFDAGTVTLVGLTLQSGEEIIVDIEGVRV